MRDRFLDVRYEVQREALLAEPDPSGYVMAALRGKAEAMCQEYGAQLQSGAPEVLVEEGLHPLLGDMVLIAARFQVRTSETVPVGELL